MRCHFAEAKTGSKGRFLSLGSPVVFRLAGVIALGLIVANCSSSVGGIDPKYGVAPSPKMVGEGQPVPKGGGRRLVGKPYKVAGRTYNPKADSNYVREGLASWYGPGFHGRMTANGEVFDRNSIAAAHTTMPLPSYARVTNMQNGRSIIVRVNDRGPFHGNRIIDVSERAASALDFKRKGTARVRVEYVGPASIHGSDDRILLASLRTDGQPASLTNTAPTMIAKAAPQQNIGPRLPAPENRQNLASVSPARPVPQAESRPIVVASYVPLPPERPLDLATIPGAASPVVASLFYASPDGRSGGFQKSQSFQKLNQSSFVLW